MTAITVPRFFDAHVHFRDGDMLRGVAPATARVCSRALVMPNVPAVLDASDALAYRRRILSATKEHPDFEPLMTVKLTHHTVPRTIELAAEAGVIAAKVYPEGATTGSHDGVRDFRALAPVYSAMQDAGMVLCVHGEEPTAFVLDREVMYLHHIAWTLREFPRLKIVLEHITTGRSVVFVRHSPDRLGATITTHHLDLTLDDVIGNGIRPHNFCYPVAKSLPDRDRLQRAVKGEFGPRFFLGSDSAPHLKAHKESACGCAGIYTAPVLASVLTGHFLGRDPTTEAVERLIDFSSRNGERFYGLEPRPGTVTLTRKPWLVVEIDDLSGVVPYRAGEWLDWDLE